MPNFTLGTPGSPQDPNAYTLAGGTPTCGSTKNQICYIIAADNGLGKPVIDTPLLGQIAASLNVRADSTNVFLKA